MYISVTSFETIFSMLLKLYNGHDLCTENKKGNNSIKICGVTVLVFCRVSDDVLYLYQAL